MLKTVQNMRKAVAGRGIEIVNYVYARLTLDEGQATREMDDGSKASDKIVADIKGLHQEMKEEHDINVDAKAFDDGKAILVSGIGKMYDNYNDGFKHIIKIKESILGSDDNEEPLVQRISDITSSEEKFVPKKKQPAKSGTLKSMPIETDQVDTKEKSKKEPVEEEEEEKPASKVSKSDAEESDAKDGESGGSNVDMEEFVISLVKTEPLDLEEVVDSIATKFNISRKEAEFSLNAIKSKNDKLDITSDIVWYNQNG